MNRSVLGLQVAAMLLVLVSGRKGDDRNEKHRSKHCELPSADEADCNSLLVECEDQLEETSAGRSSITCLDLNSMSRRKFDKTVKTSCDVVTTCRCTVAHRLHCDHSGEDEGGEFAPPRSDICFSGNTLVETDKGVMDMRALQQQSVNSNPSISVKTINAQGHVTFAPVIGWFHASDNDPAGQYTRVVLEEGRHVDMSDEHVMYTVPCAGGDRQQKYAMELSVGECVLVERDGHMSPSPIAELRKVQGDGMYSPATTTGTILVNGIGASCYPTKQARMALIVSRAMFFLGSLPICKNVPGISMLDIQSDNF